MKYDIEITQPGPGVYLAAIGNHSAVASDPFLALVLLLNRAFEAGFRVDSTCFPMAVTLGPPAPVPAPPPKEAPHAT